MIEKYSDYKFEVWEFWPDCHRMKCLGYCYTIYGLEDPPSDDVLIESDEWYETPQEARFAAIRHISLL